MMWWNTGSKEEFDNYNGVSVSKTMKLPFSPYVLGVGGTSTDFLEKRLPKKASVIYLSAMFNADNMGPYFDSHIFKLMNDKGDRVCSLMVKTKDKKTYLDFPGDVAHYIDYSIYGTSIWKQMEMEYNKETQKINIWINGINYLSVSVDITDDISRIMHTCGLYTNFVYSNEGRIGNKTPIRIYAIDKGEKAEIEKIIKYNGLLEEHIILSTQDTKRLYVVFQPVESDGHLNSILIGVGTVGTFEIVVMDENAGTLTVSYVSEAMEITAQGIQELTQLPQISVRQGQYVGIRTNTIGVRRCINGPIDIFVNGGERYIDKAATPTIGETFNFKTMKLGSSILGYSYSVTNKEDLYKTIRAGYGLDADKASYITFSEPNKEVSVTMDKIISEEFTAVRGVKVFFQGQMGRGVTQVEAAIDDVSGVVELPTITSPCTITLKKDYLISEFVNKQIRIIAR